MKFFNKNLDILLELSSVFIAVYNYFYIKNNHAGFSDEDLKIVSSHKFSSESNFGGVRTPFPLVKATCDRCGISIDFKSKFNAETLAVEKPALDGKRMPCDEIMLRLKYGPGNFGGHDWVDTHDKTYKCRKCGETCKLNENGYWTSLDWKNSWHESTKNYPTCDENIMNKALK